jgi:hypothetical protein
MNSNQTPIDMTIPNGARFPIVWDEKLIALANECAADLRRTRELYKLAQESQS